MERTKIPPGPRDQLGDNSPKSVTDPLAFFLNLQQEYGDLVQIGTGSSAWYLLTHPDYVEHVLKDTGHKYQKFDSKGSWLKPLLGEGLLTSEGETWLRQRKAMQPAFQRPRLEARLDGIVEATRRMLERWSVAQRQNAEIELETEFMRLTIEIVGRVLLNLDLSDRSVQIGETINAAVEHIFSPYRGTKPGQESGSRDMAFAKLHELITGIIELCRSAGMAKDDLLARLLPYGSDSEPSDQELREAVVTLLFTGYETCSKVLAWAWYLLAGAPDVERRLRSELDTVLSGRAPEAGDLPELKLTLQIILETMRLFPPAWCFSRRPIEDDEIDGYHIPANAIVMLSPYVTHRHPQFWPEAEKFWPDRFAPAHSTARHRFAYFPFSGGPRQCIAYQMAMMESQVILALVTQKHRLRLSPKHPVEVEAASMLRSRHGIWVTLHEPL